jgi:hypothetical protein
VVEVLELDALQAPLRSRSEQQPERDPVAKLGVVREDRATLVAVNVVR